MIIKTHAELQGFYRSTHLHQARYRPAMKKQHHSISARWGFIISDLHAIQQNCRKVHNLHLLAQAQPERFINIEFSSVQQLAASLIYKLASYPKAKCLIGLQPKHQLHIICSSGCSNSGVEVIVAPGVCDLFAINGELADIVGYFSNGRNQNAMTLCFAVNSPKFSSRQCK